MRSELIGVIPASGESHTGVWIAERLAAVVADYGLQMENIATMHSDNGSNMLCALKTWPCPLSCVVHTLHLSVGNSSRKTWSAP